MKKINIILLILVAAVTSTFAREYTSGEELISAMQKKYDGKWYKTLTFVQKTTNFKPDGTSESATWYEALTAPGKLRIDIEPLAKGGGIIFSEGTVYQFTDGKVAAKRPFVHPLLVLGFDVYTQPAATTISQIKGMGIDLSTIHEDTWQGKDVYVVGAKQGDLKAPQFWITKKDLLFVRLIQLGGKDKNIVQETQFNNYVKAKGGWVAAEVKFFNDGKLRTTEEYTNIKTGMNLSAELYDPEKFLTVDKTYYK
jgi:outer membrane lipoprotein-sorting protein